MPAHMQGVLLHPVQIYSSLALMGNLVFYRWLLRHKRFHGQVGLTWLFVYPATRFVLEFFRGDIVRGHMFGGLISTSQFVSLLFILVAGTFLIWKYRSAGPLPA